MTFEARDKRALAILAAVLVAAGIYWYASSAPVNQPTSINQATSGAVRIDTIERAEKRLAYLRSTEATVGGKQAVLKQVSSELADREKSLLSGESASQAQAQLLEILQRVAKAQNPPLQIRQVDLAQPRSFGEAYGLVTVSITVDAHIEEILNFLAGISQQPEALATDEISFGTANPKQKNMPVRLTISAVVPRRLVPEKKGSVPF